MPDHRRARVLYVFTAGVWLGLLQVGLFLSLELLLSSAFVTFVTVVLCWLIGAAAGVWVPRGPWTYGLMAAAAAAPYGSLLLLEIAPFNTSLIIVHGLFVAVAAMWAGQFFQQERETFEHVGTLFFWENNGFITGMIAAVGGFVFLGRGFLHLSPAVGFAVVLAVGALRRYDLLALVAPVEVPPGAALDRDA